LEAVGDVLGAEEVLRQVVDQEVGAPFRIRDLEPEQLMEVT
jgi:hypothetical protein